MMAHLGVDGVGEVDGGGVARQHDDFALGGKGVNLFRVEVDFQGGEEFAGVAHFLLPLHQVAQPGEALLVLLGERAAVLVLPVRGDAFLRDAVHFLGANLHFKRLAVRPDDGSVQRLIEVGARDGDEILDAAGDGPPRVVNDSQGAHSSS